MEVDKVQTILLAKKKTIISDTLKFSLDFHLEASKDEYANNHIGKLFLYNLRLVEFKPKWLSKQSFFL